MYDLGVLGVRWVGEVGIGSVRDRVRGCEEFFVDGDFEVVRDFFIFLHGLVFEGSIINDIRVDFGHDKTTAKF